MADEFLAHGSFGLVELDCCYSHRDSFRSFWIRRVWALCLHGSDYGGNVVLSLGWIFATEAIFTFFGFVYPIWRSLVYLGQAHICFAEHFIEMTMWLTSRRSQPPLALAVPLSRFTSRVGGGSAFFVRPILRFMILEKFTLCEYAADYGGRVCVNGTIDKIKLPKLPVVIPRLTIYARVRFEQIEAGVHVTKISFIDEDGKSVMPPLSGRATVTFSGQDKTQVANMIVHPANIPIQKYGEYRIDFAVGGNRLGSLPVFVLHPDKPVV